MTVPCITTPRTIPGIEGVVAVDVSGDYTCAVRGDGTVWCFGANQYGQLGNGSYADSPIPVQATLPCP